MQQVRTELFHIWGGKICRFFLYNNFSGYVLLYKNLFSDITGWVSNIVGFYFMQSYFHGCLNKVEIIGLYFHSQDCAVAFLKLS